MGVGLTGKDFSFFQIESDDVKLDQRLFTIDCKGLTIDEELGKMDSGSLDFDDPNHYYSRVLRTGVMLKITWGYAKLGADLSIPRQIYNSDVFSKQIERRGLKVFVTSPGGGGDSEGVGSYKCNFLALDMRGSDTVKRFRSGTKGDVVAAIFDKLGIPPTAQEINFQRMTEKITPDTEVMQWESDFKTLVRLAFEWRALFRLGYTSSGSLIGIFVDPWAIAKSERNKNLTGIQTNVFYEYGGNYGDPNHPTTVANVISYDWQDQSGESGTGDNVQMRWVNGQPMFIHYVAETQTVQVWELDQAKMQAELDRRGDLADQSQLVAEWLNAKTFDEIKRYFKPVTQETAPQGTGITTTIETLGNPLFTVGLQAEFGSGFPDRVRQKGVITYIRKLSHKLFDNYLCSHELADAFVFSPTGVVLDARIGG
jgi:hypothetical protein